MLEFYPREIGKIKNRIDYFKRVKQKWEIKMEGIQFVTNDKGQKIAVLIDLKKYGELWEDIYDSLTARQRAHEPRESLESVKKRLHKQGRLSG